MGTSELHEARRSQLVDRTAHVQVLILGTGPKLRNSKLFLITLLSPECGTHSFLHT